MNNMKENATTIDDIIEIISKHTGISKSKINENSKLGLDLGLDGDDAKELLIKISKVHNFKSETFNFEDFFNEESKIWGLRNLYNKIFNKTSYIDKKDITIKELFNHFEGSL
jgi:acyl carrier protein